MPADPTRNASGSRRSSRKLTSEEDVDLRRARGEISCAECRRLKLKCDKKLPCGSCCRRGCSSICPNGSLSTGSGTRFVLADTEQLHRKIAEMGQRIRQLEDALAIFQAGISNECHPLLREELLSVKFGPEVHAQPEPDDTHLDHGAQTMDALGTLTVNDQGEGRYFGRSAGTETLFLAGAELETSGDDEEPCLPIEISNLSQSFPFGMADPNKSIDVFYSFLPPQLRAWSLCETYMEQASWAFRPVTRDEVVEILTPVYKAAKERESGCDVSESISPAKISVLYMVFALGSLVDLTLPPYNSEAETYFQIGTAVLSMRSVFDCPEMATVQAVLLMAAYHGLAGKRYTMDSSWSLISLGSKLAQSIGLHRDCARWDMDARTVQRRRNLFWELFSSDQFHSLALGRPPSIRMSYVDCEFPEDEDQTMNANGEIEIGFWRWKHMFTKEIFSLVTELTLTAEPPKYETILELDRKVRERTLPSTLSIFISLDDQNCTPSKYMRGCLLSQFRSVTMLYIHRSFFAQAVLDHPINPLRSPYSPSFLAAYRCASAVIKSIINHFERFPDLCIRWWTIWTHLFSAAIIVGSIVTRAPSSSMAPSAFIELGLAVDLFEKGASHSRRARSGMAILSRLRERAFQVYSQFRSGNTAPLGVDLRLNLQQESSGADELAIFGGQTRVLVIRILRKKLASSRAKSSQSTRSDRLSTSSSGEGTAASTPAAESIPDIHPSLVEYLSQSAYSNGLTMDEALTSPSDFVDQQQMANHSTQPVAELPYRQQPGPMSQLPAEHQFSPLSPMVNALSPPNAEPFNYQTDPSFFNMFQNFEGFPEPESNSAGSSPENSGSSASLLDLGMMMSGESGMDEQWISFMRESGILDHKMNKLKQMQGL